MSEHFCIFSAQFFPSIGGVERFTQRLALALAQAGHRVTIVAAGGRGLPCRESLAPSVELVRLPSHRLLGGRLPWPKRTAEYRALLDELADEAVDHIVVNTRFYPHSLEGVRFAERMGKRAVVIDHGAAYLTMGHPLIDAIIARYEDSITARMRRHAVDFYGISQASVDWLRHFGIEAEGIIDNAIDADGFVSSASERRFRRELGIAPDETMVAFVGRLIPEKGVMALLDAARLLKRRDDISFAFAGDGALASTIDAAKLPHVHRIGPLDPTDIAALLLEADAFCLPSRSEGFCLSLLEAAACGAIPAITDVGVAREIVVDDSCGLVLPDAEAATIAAAIERLAAIPSEERKTMGARLHDRVCERFDWSATAAAVRAACERAHHRSTDPH